MTLVPQKPAWQAGMTKGNYDPLKEFKKNLVITNEQGVSAEKWKWFFEKNQTEIWDLEVVQILCWVIK